jgi:hypothetical protein
MSLQQLLKSSPALNMDLRTKCEIECVDTGDMADANIVKIPKNEVFRVTPADHAEVLSDDD